MLGESAPLPGDDTESVLAESGMGDEYSWLVVSGVISIPEAPGDELGCVNAGRSTPRSKTVRSRDAPTAGDDAMQVPNDEIRTAEVLRWEGLHLLHFSMSSCSQKVRILLREKELEWTSHPIDLTKGEQKTDWYLGINPKGVVPVLVHDGEVHVESNDILEYLDHAFPSDQGSFFPTSAAEVESAERLLHLEDEMHVDLRNVTFSYVMPGKLMKDAALPSEDELAESLKRFQQAFDELDERLGDSAFLCGDRLMLPDIAWYIAAHRLVLGGYPIERHAKLAAWYEGLSKRPSMLAEVNEGPRLARWAGAAYRWANATLRSSIRHRIDRPEN